MKLHDIVKEIDEDCSKEKLPLLEKEMQSVFHDIHVLLKESIE